jgi:hypothetical protein
MGELRIKKTALFSLRVSSLAFFAHFVVQYPLHVLPHRLPRNSLSEQDRYGLHISRSFVTRPTRCREVLAFRRTSD